MPREYEDPPLGISALNWFDQDPEGVPVYAGQYRYRFVAFNNSQGKKFTKQRVTKGETRRFYGKDFAPTKA